MATGTIRFWAAAREAAGVAEEPYDADTLAEALAAVRAAHDERLGQVLDRCSYVVDDAPVGKRPHDAVQLVDGGSIEVLPPFAGGSADADPRASRIPPAALAPLGGLAAAAVAAGLAGLSLLHVGALAAGV